MTATKDRHWIDFAGIKDRNPIGAFLDRHGHREEGHGKRRCVSRYHDDRNASMTVDKDDLGVRCWSCGFDGDVFDIAAEVYGLDPEDRVGQARALDPSIDPSKPLATPKPKAPVAAREKGRNVGAWRDRAWQAEAARLVAAGVRNLWSPEGAAALDWLRDRGLTDETIRRFRLGFFPRGGKSANLAILGSDRKGRPRRLWLPRGIVIPYLAPGQAEGAERWAAIMVRRLADGDVWGPLAEGEAKYVAAAGSERGHLYPTPVLDVADPQTGEVAPVMILEGELDALLAWQLVGSILNVTTIGGATQGPTPEALAELANFGAWGVASDADGAGVAAFWRWEEIGGERVRRLLIPRGKDFGEFVQGGGDAVEWARSAFYRAGLGWIAKPVDPASKIEQEQEPEIAPAEQELPAPHPIPADFREIVAGWPPELASRWGIVAEIRASRGADRDEAERSAFRSVVAEIEATPSLLPDPEPSPIVAVGPPPVEAVRVERLAPTPEPAPTSPTRTARPAYLDVVNGWPSDRLAEWSALVAELESMGVGWREAESDAFARMNGPEPSPPFATIAPDEPRMAWYDDDSLAVSVAEVRASIEFLSYGQRRPVDPVPSPRFLPPVPGAITGAADPGATLPDDFDTAALEGPMRAAG